MSNKGISKEFIIKYLKEYYTKHKNPPLSKDKHHPFSNTTVVNKFGGWNKALKEADIPLNKHESKQINCKNCDKIIYKLVSQINKYNNSFCSLNCSAIYYNKTIDRTLNETSKNKIREKLQKPHKCLICDTIINSGYRKTCSQECLEKNLKINGKKGGSKGGIISAACQQKRSKNEIMFADLCIKKFGKENVLCNVPYFVDKTNNKWDADIIIKSLKIAILYDGWYWHYGPNVSNRQKARDLIKRQVIKNNGYEYYTIIDKGKFNKDFVQNQFDLFIHKQLYKKVLSEMLFNKH